MPDVTMTARDLDERPASDVNPKIYGNSDTGNDPYDLNHVEHFRVLVRITRTGAAPTPSRRWHRATLGRDGAVYRPSYEWELVPNPCRSDIALPTNGTRECKLVFEVPGNFRSARLTWRGSLLGTTASFTFHGRRVPVSKKD